MTPNMKVPFLDLVTPHLELEEELVAVFRNTLRTAGFVGGPVVEGFEHDFAQFCDVQYCIGVGSGTDAVRFALMAAGVQPGESVITAPNTFIATTEAMSQAGALPEFVDIDDRTYNMDPEKLREYLERRCDRDQRTGKPVSRRTGRTIAAVVPVHLYGQPADMDPILELAETYNLVLIEDACQAHGAEYFSQKEKRWRKAGSMGVAGAFSFYPGKNLGACGEAGAVTTNDPALAQKVRQLRDHGQAEKYYHDIEGYNGRLDAIQAGLLQTKLRCLSKWNSERRKRASTYKELLAGGADQIILPHEPSWAIAVYHLYVIRSEERDQLRTYLSTFNIGTGIHYPVPLHVQKAYSGLGYKEGCFPVTERVAAQIVSLPIYPQINAEQQREVADRILSFVPEGAGSAVRIHVPAC
jgi:dTDP-4-amino-4,6-dideoxygalactose transaminase